MTVVEDYVAILSNPPFTFYLWSEGRKSPEVETVIKDNKAKALGLLRSLPDITCDSERRLSHKVLLNLWKVGVGRSSFRNETPGTHFRYCQAKWTGRPFTESLVDDSEDTVAWLRVGEISISLVDEVITLRASLLSSIQS